MLLKRLRNILKNLGNAMSPVKTDRRVGNYSGRTNLGVGTTSTFTALTAIIRSEISLVDLYVTIDV